MKHDGSVYGALFDKAEARILSPSQDGTVRFWLFTSLIDEAVQAAHHAVPFVACQGWRLLRSLIAQYSPAH